MANHKINYQTAIFGFENGMQKYLGAVFGYEGGSYSHSILCHGADLLPTVDDARADFFATKAALPAGVHRAIFGT